MKNILGSLLIAAMLTSAVAFADQPERGTVDTGKQRVAFTLHGKTSCVLVDDKIFCSPAPARAPMKVASTGND